MNARETIDLYATLADMKEVDCQNTIAITDLSEEVEHLKEMLYKNTLALTTLLDLLVEKSLITPAEIAERAQKLDGLGK